MLEDVIRRARRRFILNEALSRAAVSCVIVAGGLAVVLLVGTRWLEWWTLALLALIAIGYAAFELRRAVPSRYAAAIRLDREAGLDDSLSTALHFAAASGAFAEAQRSQAAEAARTVKVESAIPLHFPRALYGAGAMLLLAGAIVGVRYGVAHTLDLRAPITEVFFADQAAHKSVDKSRDQREALRRRNLEAAESLLAKMGVPINPEDAHNQDALDRAIEQALAPPSAAPGEKAAGKGENGRGGNGMEQTPKGDPIDDKPAGAPPGSDSKESADKGSPKAGGNSDGASLLSKLKDAVSNMLSKASQNKEGSGQKNSGQQQNQSAKSDKGKSDKGAGKGQEPGEDSAEAQDGQPDGDAKEGQEGQSKAASKSAQQAGQAGSGVGNQDGSKDLKAAEQLKAMGKLSEIIGKRAKSISGETMIEVQSGNQKLSTAYSRRSATHSETDGDVSRDEIPVGLQPYVREYFEQVRKTAPPAKTAH